MKIKQLQLKNYGRFDDLTIAFAPTAEKKSNVTIIVGNNGAGKSQILQALATGLSWFIELLKDSNGIGNLPNHLSIKNGKSDVLIKITAQDEYRSKNISWEISSFKQQDFRGNSSFNYREDGLKDLIGNYVKGFRKGLIHNLPLVALSGDTRNNQKWNHENLDESFTANILTGYENSLTMNNSFFQFIQWFRDNEDVENEEILRKLDENSQLNANYSHSIQLLRLEEQEIKNRLDFAVGLEKAKMYNQLSYIQEQIFRAEQAFQKITLNLDSYKNSVNFEGRKSLNAVRVAIEEFTGLKNPKIRRQGTPTMIVEKDGQELDVNQLSQGEKSLLALVGDIARRLAILNPSLENPLLGEGVVMIDEVDLHLHPKWQHDLIDKLVRTFPKVQFILTTHSPLIVSDRADVLVYVLDDGELYETGNIYGADANALLNDVFDVPPRTPEIEEKFNEILRDLSEKNIESAEEKVKKLAQVIAPNSEQLFKVKLLLAKEKISKNKELG
ncbi:MULTISPECIES: AAA family ATPase [unclassified Acinetobacter]|uniref:AAA family ATPase n=1 Tax=unclassified Acinetobacter TaxID=196816 RepID=UPI0035B76D7B